MGLLGAIGRGFNSYLDRGVNGSLAGVPPGLLNLGQTGIGPQPDGTPPMMTPQDRHNLRMNYLMHLGQGIAQGSPAAHLGEFRNEQVNSAIMGQQLHQQQQENAAAASAFAPPPSQAAPPVMGGVGPQSPPVLGGVASPIASPGGASAAPAVAAPGMAGAPAAPPPTTAATKPGDPYRRMAQVMTLHGKPEAATKYIEIADKLDKDPTKENQGAPIFTSRDGKSFIHQGTKEGPGVDTPMDPSLKDIAETTNYGATATKNNADAAKLAQDTKDEELKYLAGRAQDPNMTQESWTALRNAASPGLQSQIAPMFSPKAAASLQRMGVSPDQVSKEDAAVNKPEAQVQLRKDYGAAFAKLQGAGLLKPGDVSDMGKTVAAFRAAPDSLLSPAEKAAAIGYLGANPTIASQGTVANIRVEGLQNSREYPVMDDKGNLVMLPSNIINASPGKYAPAGAAAAATSKQAVFQDLHLNIDTARKAMSSLGDMSPGDRAALAFNLRSTNPKSAMQTFLTGAAATRLTPQQQEAAQSLALLSENAMTLRSVAGMGAGSDDLRAAIQATLPSAKSPNMKYSLQQLDKFEAVVNRLEGGVPGTPKNPRGVAPGAQPAGSNHDKLMRMIQGLP